MKLTVDKKDVAKIIAAWWVDYEAHPNLYEPGPDSDGKSSADCFFEFAAKTGAGKLTT